MGLVAEDLLYGRVAVWEGVGHVGVGGGGCFEGEADVFAAAGDGGVVEEFVGGGGAVGFGGGGGDGHGGEGAGGVDGGSLGEMGEMGKGVEGLEGGRLGVGVVVAGEVPDGGLAYLWSYCSQWSLK